MPTFCFPRHLRHELPLPGRCEVQGNTMAEILDELERRFPGLKGRILNDQGQVHHHVQLFIGDRWLEDRQGLSDRIAPSDEVLMIEAVSGG